VPSRAHLGRPRSLGLLLGLFVAGLALRPQLVGVGPLIPEIQDDLDVSHAVAGLLGTIPVLCMGLFAPPAPHLSRRIGSRAAVGASLALVAVFGVARTVVHSAAFVILLTVPIGVGMGLAGTLLPVAVKERFAHRPAFATGIYATGLNVGSAASSALAFPVAAGLGSWRWSLLLFSLATGGVVVGWVAATRHEEPHRRVDVPHVRIPWRSSIGWRLVLVFALLSCTFYGLNSWLPDAYVEHGWTKGSAGGLLAALNLAALAPTLLVTWLADRAGSRRLYLAAAGALLIGSVLGLVLAPGGAWAWAIGAGIAVGMAFPLVMTLPLDVAHGPAQVGAVAAMMLGVGYTVSGLSPFALGAIRDGTGSFDAVLWLLVGAAAGLLALALSLSPARLRRAGLAEPAPVP
jgi:CP family cyanate transporter-like MFS transporter